MRESIERVIDDFETKEKYADKRYGECMKDGDTVNTSFYGGYGEGFHYAIKELRKVLDDHGKS